MKIAENIVAEQKENYRQKVQDVFSGKISAQGSDKTKHGKAGELVFSEMFNLNYEQTGAGADFPKEIMKRCVDLPEEFHEDADSKCMNIKNRNNVFLGDAIKALRKIKKNGLVLIIFWYKGHRKDGNLVGIEIIKIQSSEVSTPMQKAMSKCSAYVKNRMNCIYKTREEVVNVNKKHRTPALYLNNCSNSDSDNRQIQLKLNISRLATA